MGLDRPQEENQSGHNTEDEDDGEVSVQPQLDHVAAQTQRPCSVH